MLLPKAENPTYICQHFKWEKWTHYGCVMPEGGCKLSEHIFACKYTDGKHCPNYEPKEVQNEAD